MRPEQSITTQILGLIESDDMKAGAHMRAQPLADRLRVSRSPVNDALSFLAEKGVLVRQPNRGYFLVEPLSESVEATARRLGLEDSDTVTEVYFRIADDRLSGALPGEFTEVMLKQRYGLTPAQLNAVLARIASEGWAERKPGYGWEFSSMLTTADSLLQSYRLRLALEPAALLEPGYHLAPGVIARCRAAELHLLNGGIETDTADQMHDRGVRFHESVVEGCGNAFFIDTIRRVNRVRRLLSYRSMKDRSRYKEHCQQHLHLLDLIERGHNDDASKAMQDHLSSTLRNLKKITGILKS
ncbi:GntR family transcriptional regulator [Variovorax boronicumulans]|uniref:GntR family transcriptional regulator n=1 Tax=Variovorax boronicumulans TaxID=436515 RepID=UPI002476A6D8|nr:GntR family transcriptional regulator [Variovorax boronicumulans]